MAKQIVKAEIVKHLLKCIICRELFKEEDIYRIGDDNGKLRDYGICGQCLQSKIP